MPPIEIIRTVSSPNPRKDINPSQRIIVVIYRTPYGRVRADIFGENENWRPILEAMVNESQELLAKIPSTITV